MQEQKPVGVLLNGFGRVAPALEVMRHIEFQLGVARVRRLQNLLYLFGTLSQRAHVVVVSERNSQVGGALSYFCDELAQAYVIR